MAMNNMNYGYPTASGFSSPYSSTPTGMRSQRPRFAFSGPSPYPRPRSSASKPNPESLSDSMINNFGSSVSQLDASYPLSRMDSSFPENGNSLGSSYRSQNSTSNYYSCNDTFLPSPEKPLRGNAENIGYIHDQSSQFAPSKYLYDNNTSFGIHDGGDIQGRFQKNQLEKPQSLLPSNKQKQFSRRFAKAKRNMTEKTQKGEWRCDLCDLDFTSQIPLDMHLRGAKHAKKVKAKSVLQTIQMQAKEIDTQGKAFHCELCNVTANSSLQFQTHLDGNKHKNKLQQQQPKEESKPEGLDVPKTKESEINGKSNGTLIRPLPPEFGEPQPSKVAKSSFSCDICSIVVNSDTQLQQHLSSKRHQAKVEGKPFHKGKKNKQKQAEELEGTNAESTSLENAKPEEEEETEDKTSEVETKTVMGVKTLTSSFVQGETLQ